MKTKAGRDIHAHKVTTPDRSVSLERDSELPGLARRAVETFVLEHSVIAPTPSQSDSVLNQSAGCFVCIKSDGELRGCIGTIDPARNTLAEEIIANAISAATRDPRFQPVSDTELPKLHYSVDVLYTPEPAKFEDLDPAEFGVIVEDEEGLRRGLLLPNIEGVETSTQQVRIAARKAGIPLHVPLRLQRFRVRRFSELA